MMGVLYFDCLKPFRFSSQDLNPQSPNLKASTVTALTRNVGLKLAPLTLSLQKY